MARDETQMLELRKRLVAIEAGVVVTGLVAMAALFQAAHRELREGQSA